MIVLLGAGGKKFERAHIRDTVQADLDPLSLQEQASQAESIERGLKFSSRGIPHISRYDIREFVY